MMAAQQTLSKKHTSLYSEFFIRLFFIWLTVFPVNLLLAQDYRGENISEYNLSEQDLTGALFDNTTIFSDGTNGVNLSNTQGTGANLSVISGAVDFRGVNLTGVNLSSANLTSVTINNTTVFSNGTVGANLANSSLDLSNADFSNADFRGVNLTGVNMTDTDLTNAAFSSTTVFSDGVTGANLSNFNSNGANLSDLNFSTTDFRRVNLTGVNLTNAVLTGANIENTTVFSSVSGGGFGTSVGANLTNYNGDANLSGLDFSSMDFRGVNLSGVDLTNTILTSATFDANTVFSSENGGGMPVGANLTNTNGNGASFSGNSMNNVDFRGVNLTGVNLMDTVLTLATFDNTTIFSNGTIGANLSNGMGNGANLANVYLNGVDFRGVNLSGVDMTNADLSNATFSSTTVFTDGFSIGANLSNDFGTGAYFGGLNLGFLDLRFVNLSGANFTDANLSNAQFDNTTVFSNGSVGVNLSGTNANLSNLDLRFTNFQGANLSGVNLVGSNLANVDLSSTTFDHRTKFSDGIVGASLAGTNANLSGIDFSLVNASTDFRGVNFTGVNLSNATLSSNKYSLVAYDTNTIFSDGVNGANLSNTLGTGAVLLNISTTIDLRGVNLVGVSFYDNDEGESSNLEEALLDRTTIFSNGTVGVNLSATRANLSGLDLSNVDFRGANISGLDFTNANLTGALFDQNTIFSDIDGYGVNLFNDAGTGADLSEIDFSQSNDTGWGFEGANLVGVNLSNAVLSDGQSTSIMSFNYDTIFSDGTTGANLSNTNGNGAIISGLIEYSGNFKGVNLVGAKFSSSILEETDLFDKTTIFSDGVYGVDFSDTWANLSNLDLSNVDFRGANLNSTSLSGSNLNGANFTDTQLSDTNLSSAQYNSFTTWPVNYEADSKGAIRVDQKFHDYLNERVAITQQEGNQSGISAVLANPNSYDLYRHEDGSLVDANNTNPNYQSGYNDGYNSSFNAIKENPANYGLFSEEDRNNTILNESIRVLAKVQAEFAMEGMSLVLYQEKSIDSNATQTKDWYYQPENGWSWTNRSVYPYLFVNQENGEGNQTLPDRWLYHNQIGPKDYLFYDFNTQDWINPF
jgi:uncharacterized protein YjbI with pentapeptide repeats